MRCDVLPILLVREVECDPGCVKILHYRLEIRVGVRPQSFVEHIDHERVGYRGRRQLAQECFTNSTRRCGHFGSRRDISIPAFVAGPRDRQRRRHVGLTTNNGISSAK